MSVRIQMIIVVAALLAVFYIVQKIRMKEIELRYSLLWMILGIGIILFACFPQFTEWLAHMLGICQPVNMLFFAGFCFMLPIIFSLSVAVSKLSNKVKRLTQEIALLQEEERKEKDEIVEKE